MSSNLHQLYLQVLLYTWIQFCNGQGHMGGSRSGGSWGGSRRGGGGFMIFSGRSHTGQSRSYGDDENVYTYLEPIFLILLLLLAIAVLVLMWKWASYCHKIVTQPDKLSEKNDPEKMQREVVARYQALRQAFEQRQQRGMAAGDMGGCGIYNVESNYAAMPTNFGNEQEQSQENWRSGFPGGQFSESSNQDNESYADGPVRITISEPKSSPDVGSTRDRVQ